MLANISVSYTKFHHILAVLPSTVISCLDTATIDRLKTEVVAQSMTTNTELLDQLFQDIPFTGRPSQHLRALRKLGQRIGAAGDVVRHRSQRSLPIDLVEVVTMQKTGPLEELGKLADEMLAITPGTQHVQAVQPAAEVDAVKRVQGMNKGVEPFNPGQRPEICRAHISSGSDLVVHGNEISEWSE